MSRGSAAIILRLRQQRQKARRQIDRPDQSALIHQAHRREPVAEFGRRLEIKRLPHRKDIVIFSKLPVPGCGSDRSIERVIGLPGETVSERNGFVSIDGTFLVPSHYDMR